jgi:predicted RNA methylase
VTTVEAIRVSPDWLDLRERADAAARARRLVDELRRRASADGRWSIHDLACGSGSLGRWLAPLLPGPQHWVLHDRDEDLLALASVQAPAAASDGADITIETRLSDVTRLEPEDLAGATLVTASALLDLLTREELTRLIHACTGAGCPVLFALSVTGRVQLLAADPLDSRIAAAFNAHQRRLTQRGRLLGPDAVAAAVEGFRETGAEVVVHPSPWRLGGGESDLAVEWLTGWLDAAWAQDPALAREADLYRHRRLREAAAGALSVTVGHADLLVLP